MPGPGRVDGLSGPGCRSGRRPGGRSIAFTAFAVVLTALVVLAAAVVASTVGQRVAGSGSAAERVLPAAGGIMVRDGTEPALGPPTGVVVGAVLTDVLDFFRRSLPSPGLSAPTGGVVAVDPSATAFGPAGVPCLGSPRDVAGNATYCPSADAIVYDAGGLVPVLIGRYGVAGLAVALAHEFGHAVQARVGPTPADRSIRPGDFPGLLVEGQSDCYAGAFLRWVVDGRAPHVIAPAQAELRALGPLLDFRDPVDIRPDDPTAHGLGVDRLSSAMRGIRDGAAACRRLTVADLDPVLGRTGTVPRQAPPRFPDPAGVQTAALPGVLALIRQWPGTGSVAPIRVTADPADLSAAAPLGQFATAAALTLAAGRAVAGPSAAACFVGAWTATVFGHSGPGALGGWTGDADEAMDLIRDRPGAVFADLVGFQAGFSGGPTECS